MLPTMSAAARQVADSRVRPSATPLRAPTRAMVGMAIVLALAACPAPTPVSQSATPRGEAEPDVTPPVAPVAPVAPPPTATPEPTPTEPDLSPEPEGPPLPAALAAEGVSPLARTLWRALRATDDGDNEAMGRAMLSGARWFPPGRPDESVSTLSGLPRAMAPWTSPNVTLELHRIIDLGPARVVAQLAVRDLSKPKLDYEIALFVDARGEQIAAVRQYGDPLGPVRPRPEDPGRTLRLGTEGEVAREGGAPTIAHVALTKTLVTALGEDDADAVKALLADDVILHDVKARRTSGGPQAYLEGYRGMLGKDGAMQILHQHATRSFVVMEGAIFGIDEADDGTPREHGFADIHRLESGKIVETWHYLNRRGRPRLPSKTTELAPH